MYRNRQFRECRNGSACYFLQNGTCWFYHPESHFDSANQFENQYPFNHPISNINQRQGVQYYISQRQQTEAAEENYGFDLDLDLDLSHLIDQISLVQQKRQKKKDEADLSWFDEEEEAELSKIWLNGKEVQLLRISSMLSDSKKWYFQKSYHFNFFEECCHKDCSICLCQFEAQNIVTLLFCNHAFHKQCIQKWVITSDKCPLCRKDLTAHEQFKKMKGYTQKPKFNPLNPYNNIHMQDIQAFSRQFFGNDSQFDDFDNMQDYELSDQEEDIGFGDLSDDISF